MSGYANSLSEGRVTHTSITLPDIGKPTEFEKLGAGDHFLYEGQLFFKTNLQDGVPINSGKERSIGCSKFRAKDIVSAVDVRITILR